jgi:hypothetical protein
MKLTPRAQAIAKVLTEHGCEPLIAEPAAEVLDGIVGSRKLAAAEGEILVTLFRMVTTAATGRFGMPPLDFQGNFGELASSIIAQADRHSYTLLVEGSSLN